MSDDCGGDGGDSGGCNDSYSYDSPASNNDYSSNNAQADSNDFAGIGSTFTALSNAMDMANEVEHTKSAFTKTNDDSSTRLQIDDVPSDDKYGVRDESYCYNHSIDYVPPVGNYARGNDYFSKNRWTTTNANCNRNRFDGDNSRTRDSQNRVTSVIAYIISFVIVIAFVIFFIYMINRDNDQPRTSYEPIKIEPLPQGVYNTLNMKWPED